MKYTYVKDLMTSPAISCEDTISIKSAIELMKHHNIGFLPITRNNIIVGVITDRDILIRGIGTYKLSTKINRIMTSGEIIFTSPSDTLLNTAKIMAEKKIRRIVVLNDGKIVGVLTTKNMLNAPELLPYIINTYTSSQTLPSYSMYLNSNPHDSIKASDFPL